MKEKENFSYSLMEELSKLDSLANYLEIYSDKHDAHEIYGAGLNLKDISKRLWKFREAVFGD